MAASLGSKPVRTSGAVQAKLLVLVCTFVVVLQSASLSLARGEDGAPEFHRQTGADDEV